MPGQLVVAGDGPLLEDVRRQARSIPRVDVRGRVGEAEKDDLLARAWVVLSAAHHEGWGMSVLEGAAFGTPSLAIDAPGIRDVLIDGVTGRLVFPSDDAEAPAVLGRAMEDFVEVGWRREELGAAARRRALDLSWNRSVDRWEAALMDAASQEPARTTTSRRSTLRQTPTTREETQ
jgi:glycosyltransferase involved in cell wall biosynthesis